MTKLNILIGGCRFIGSNLIFHLIPHSKHIIFLDRERVEKENYDNSIFPKNYVGRRKVTALVSLTQLISSIQTTPIHLDVKDVSQLESIIEKQQVDFMFISFDNIEARAIAKESAINSNIPTLFIGVPEGYIYIDWESHLLLSNSPIDIKKMKNELRKIRDVCTKLEFRPLGAIASGYAYHCFTRWINNKEKIMYNISDQIPDNIHVFSDRKPCKIIKNSLTQGFILKGNRMNVFIPLLCHKLLSKEEINALLKITKIEKIGLEKILMFLKFLNINYEIEKQLPNNQIVLNINDNQINEGYKVLIKQNANIIDVDFCVDHYQHLFLPELIMFIRESGSVYHLEGFHY